MSPGSRCDFAMKLQVERPNVPGVGLSEERCRDLGVTGSDLVARHLTNRGLMPEIPNNHPKESIIA